MGWTLAFLILLAFFERNAALGLLPIGFLMAVTMSVGVRGAAAAGTAAVGGVCTWDGHARLRGVRGRASGRTALAALLEQGFPQTRVLGFLDDRLSGQTVAGHRILGAERDLDTVHAVHNINQLWLTFSPESHKHERLRRMVRPSWRQVGVLPEVRPFLELLERRHGDVEEAGPAPRGSGSLGRPETRSNRARLAL
jgi:hypothetical protein